MDRIQNEYYLLDTYSDANSVMNKKIKLIYITNKYKYILKINI
jgi:hypothetical protein